MVNLRWIRPFRCWSVFASLALPLALSIGAARPDRSAERKPSELDPIVDGNNAFAFSLYSKIVHSDGNAIFSPFSVSTAMAVAYAGARGATEQEVARALHIGAANDAYHAGMARIRDSLAANSNKDHIALNIANGVWLQRDFTFHRDYLDLAQKSYAASLQTADFRSDAKGEAGRINAWVANKTHGKINGIFAPGDFTDLTRLVIANAIYFKGDWASRFEKSETKPQPFWTTPARSIDAPMMHQNHIFAYREADNCQILELPYIGLDFSMLIVLPKSKDGLPALEAQLSTPTLARRTQGERYANLRTVDVLLPKFSLSSRFDLHQAFENMGISDAFNAKRADFSGIATAPPPGRLYISRVLHAAIVEVDEQGTVAAAATGVSVPLSCSVTMPPPPATFHADHPFVFVIRENQTGTILFMGRVTDPAMVGSQP